MKAVGYGHLIKTLELTVRPPAKPAYISGSVNRRVDTEDRIAFPSGVAINDTALGHLEFAVRHEGIDLATIAAALPHIGREPIITHLRETPNGEYIRRIAFLWEWLTGTPLDAGVKATARYVDLFDPERYVGAHNAQRHSSYRVRNNALGNTRFCPIVHRSACPEPQWLEDLLSRAVKLAGSARASGNYERALQYLYLSETKGSFAIERETPSAHKEERFVQILRRAPNIPRLTEEQLVEIQNAVVRDDFAREAGYRTRQNWLENNTGRISFLPHPPDTLQETMDGWETFANDTEGGIDPLLRMTCASFGFVYIHPFMDGNGRLHRYVLHHVLAHSGLIPPDLILPVSAVIMKNIPHYHQVLTAFSAPVTQLWDYRRLDDGPDIRHSPGPEPYRYPVCNLEVEFLKTMFQQTVDIEIPEELAWLQGYDRAYQEIDAAFDLPANEISRLIRMIHGNEGRLARGKRNQFDWIPENVLTHIERIVQKTLTNASE